MVGFARLYKVATSPWFTGAATTISSLSHFSRWASGIRRPERRRAARGLGRLADERYPAATRNVIVNLGNAQSLAVRGREHSPWCVDDPARFRRDGTDEESMCSRS